MDGRWDLIAIGSTAEHETRDPHSPRGRVPFQADELPSLFGHSAWFSIPRRCPVEEELFTDAATSANVKRVPTQGWLVIHVPVRS